MTKGFSPQPLGPGSILPISLLLVASRHPTPGIHPTYMDLSVGTPVCVTPRA